MKKRKESNKYKFIKTKIKFMKVKQFLTPFLLSSLLLANTVAAQVSINDVWNTVSFILVQFSGLIFLAVFILIFLLVTGTIKLRGLGRFPWGTLVFLIFIILVFFIPNFITFPDYVREVPSNFKQWEFPPAAKSAIGLIGLPTEWGYVPAIIYLFFLPFAAVYTLFWAFLQSLSIFPQANVNRALALIVAFMTIPLGWFVKMVWALFAFMGIWSVLIFVAMFIAGVFFRGAGFVSGEAAALGRRLNARARHHLDEALRYINSRQAADAIRELQNANNMTGFHSDYYGHISAAAGELSAPAGGAGAPPDWGRVAGEIKNAIKFL